MTLARMRTHSPKSGASANSATFAWPTFTRMRMLSGPPLLLHDALQAVSPCLHPTRIVLLCRLDRTVTKQLCYVLLRHSIYEQFNRERVPEHMWSASGGRSKIGR